MNAGPSETARIDFLSFKTPTICPYSLVHARKGPPPQAAVCDNVAPDCDNDLSFLSFLSFYSESLVYVELSGITSPGGA